MTTTYEKQWRLSAIGYRIVKIDANSFEIRVHNRYTGEFETIAGTNDLPVLVNSLWESWWANLWRSRVLTAPSHVEYEQMLDRAHQDAFKTIKFQPQSGAAFRRL